jgi:RNA polymerase sigma-70 factor, ECF subfamily
VGRPQTEHERFAAMFDEESTHVFAYALRQLGSAADAQDVVADTFLVAWRRWADVPDRALPWLLVVARNTIANRRRHERRQSRLTDTAAVLERLAGPAAGADQSVIERAALLQALGQLSEAEREALVLVAWTPLSRAEAAAVAGCSQRAFEVRLSRARARLTRCLDDAADRIEDAHA